MNEIKLRFYLLSMCVLFPISTPYAMSGETEDECSVIRDLISKVPDSGGEVVIKDGDYTCLAPIVLNKSNITLRGQRNVTIRLGPNVNAPVIIMGDTETPPRPLRNIQVANLRIDGNRWHQKYECWGGPCDSGGTSFIRNNGITVRAITNARIQNVFITGARSGGVVTERGCYDLEIDQLTAVDNEFDGFAGYETFGARLSRMDLSGNKAAGISLDIRFHGNYFQDISINNNGDVGIFMRDSNFNVFENVRISNSGSHGIFVAQDRDNATCSLDNDFQNLKVIKSRGYGFRLNDSCNGNRLLGTAEFVQNRDGCISEADGARLLLEGSVLCQD